MEGITCFLALSFLLADPELGYNAQADRRRFPPDCVLADWKRANECRRWKLRELLDAENFVSSRPWVREEYRDYVNAEIGELERIWNIMNWLQGEWANESTMRSWFRHARMLMTEDEYLRADIGFGGLPGWK